MARLRTTSSSPAAKPIRRRRSGGPRPNGLRAPIPPPPLTAAASGNGQNISGQRALSDVIPLQGGVPIKVGDVTIGGVGLSGAPMGGPQEEACGKAGIAKIADQLK